LDTFFSIAQMPPQEWSIYGNRATALKGIMDRAVAKGPQKNLFSKKTEATTFVFWLT